MTDYWIVARHASITMSELTEAEKHDLEAKGFQPFTIGRGRHAPIVGYAQDARDVGRIRQLLLNEDERNGR